MPISIWTLFSAACSMLKPLSRFDHFKCGAARHASRWSIMLNRRAKDRHQPIALQLIHCPMITDNGIDHQGKIIVEQFNRLGRVLFFTDSL